jgi:hypothetical protein
VLAHGMITILVSRAANDLWLAIMAPRTAAQVLLSKLPPTHSRSRTLVDDSRRGHRSRVCLAKLSRDPMRGKLPRIDVLGVAQLKAIRAIVFDSRKTTFGLAVRLLSERGSGY